jgi:pilus assembly protein CpaF
MLTVIVESDDRRETVHRVSRLPCRIGKSRDAEVCLPSWRVARVHAEILAIDRGFKLIDCGSIGGTWVNGERIVEYGPLDASDEVTIAGFRLRVDTRAGRAAAGGGATSIGARRTEPVSPSRSPEDSAAIAEGLLRSAESSGSDDREVWRGWQRVLHRKLLHAIDLRRKDVRQLSEAQLREDVRGLLVELLDQEAEIPEGLDRNALISDILDEAIGLGPLERLLSDPSVTEIMVNGADAIFVERDGRLEHTDIAFTGDEAVRSVIDRIVAPLGRRVDESSPMVDARLPDGSRVNAVLPPLAIRGPSITIRRFNRRVLEPRDLVELGTLSDAMLEFLRVCVQSRRNIVISGGTGSGKTTLLNVMSNLIPMGERIVTIEDAAELRLFQSNLVSLESRPSNAEGRGAVTIRDLVRNALRMRPDRIVVGECRGGEALDMLQAMNTGHDGSLTTVHANSPRDVVSRLETLVLMSGVEIPVAAIRDQIASAVDVIVHQARMSDGRRRVTDICEVTGIEAQRVAMQAIFRSDRPRSAGLGTPLDPEPSKGVGLPCGIVPQFYEELGSSGLHLDLDIFGSREAR